MTNLLVNRLEEFAFLLENGADVDARDILHAVAPELSNVLEYGPKGSTQADAWMAKHGHPLASTEAAMALARLVEPGGELLLSARPENATAGLRLPKTTGAPRVTADSLPVAIVAAACLYLLERDRS